MTYLILQVTTRLKSNFNTVINATLILLTLQFALALFISSPVQAETRYVIPSSEIPVRRGQGNDYKIVALISDGTKVEVLERGESYSLVRLENDKEGWILTRFLSQDPPLSEVVARLTIENESLNQERQQTAEKLSLQEQESSLKQEELTMALADIEQKLAMTQADKAAITASYEKLKKDTADVVETKKKLIKTINENKLVKQKMSNLTQENAQLKSEERINWFLAGGGVLLLGIIIGKITGRSKKRKPSLL